jgi:prevent-host-death family protein
MTMKMTSVAELKKHLSSYLALAEEGETIEVRKRNVPVARLIGIPRQRVNRTKLGCGKGTGNILGDITEPLVPAKNWDMLKEDA